MIEIKENRERLAPLFRDYRWNYMVEAVLDGMTGRAWADNLERPLFSVVEFPRVQLYIPGGDPVHPEVKAWLASLPKPAALVFTSAGWESKLKEVHREGIIELTRYAFSSESLRMEHLRELAVKVPAGYRLERMNLSLAQTLAAEQSRFAGDHFLNYDSVDQLLSQGFGFCALHGKEIVSVATTFVVCRRGVEIQINTREGHQGKGLATVVAARLMLHSLEQGLDPGWDAANEISLGLAKKLGYTPQGMYTLYVVREEG